MAVSWCGSQIDSGRCAADEACPLSPIFASREASAAHARRMKNALPEPLKAAGAAPSFVVEPLDAQGTSQSAAA
ncbi:hypothetical protein AB4Y44_40660 [Paraburkholderia sp. BR10937]|uniref:hypothetical protein n=1 Tax=Paraburkholderia sp. BR10937 TaxID=3236994 RepID=UPI0034D1C9F4